VQNFRSRSARRRLHWGSVLPDSAGRPMSTRSTLTFVMSLLLILPALTPAQQPARNRERPLPLDCTSDKGVSAADVRKAQEAWAQYLRRKVEETVEIADGVSMTFVLVPPGRFGMGSPEGAAGHVKVETLHRVVLTEPFDLGKTEVTQAQYKALTGKEPSKFKDSGDLPVEQVSWREAREFGARLTKKRSDRHVYRLPTEAEWEYACRGGRSQPFGIGDGHSLSSREANFDGNFPFGGAKGVRLDKTSRVGSYAANALGLYDMHGNVWEWCADVYDLFPPARLQIPPARRTAPTARPGCSGAAPGAASAGTAVPRSGTQPGPTTETPTSAFAWPAVFRPMASRARQRRSPPRRLAGPTRPPASLRSGPGTAVHALDLTASQGHTRRPGGRRLHRRRTAGPSQGAGAACAGVLGTGPSVVEELKPVADQLGGEGL
jgi:formylglycine-generating enzyme required for sulfatase activity